MTPQDELLGRPLALVVALALVSLLPFVFMSVTMFLRSNPFRGTPHPWREQTKLKH